VPVAPDRSPPTAERGFPDVTSPDVRSWSHMSMAHSYIKGSLPWQGAQHGGRVRICMSHLEEKMSTNDEGVKTLQEAGNEYGRIGWVHGNYYYFMQHNYCWLITVVNPGVFKA
jgi:hypothetical protein